jgi:hypothetical protein
MASITVKKADGTTDIVYDAVNASGGESSPAVWRQDTGAPAGLPVGQRPSFTLQSKWNGPKSARQLQFNFAAPYATQDSTTTIYSSKDRIVVSGVVTLPQNIPASNLNEAAAQSMNLLASTLVKACLQAGYAPT